MLLADQLEPVGDADLARYRLQPLRVPGIAGTGDREPRARQLGEGAGGMLNPVLREEWTGAEQFASPGLRSGADKPAAVRAGPDDGQRLRIRAGAADGVGRVVGGANPPVDVAVAESP